MSQVNPVQNLGGSTKCRMERQNFVGETPQNSSQVPDKEYRLLYLSFSQHILIALDGVIPGGGPPTRKRPYSLDPGKVKNSYYIRAKRGDRYWPYDRNDPFTYRERVICKNILKKNPSS